MEIKTLKRLVTCLKMMESEHDGEALAAARRASKIVEEHKLDWGDIVKVAIDQPVPQFVATGTYQPSPKPSPQHSAQYNQSTMEERHRAAQRQFEEMMNAVNRQGQYQQQHYGNLGGCGGGAGFTHGEPKAAPDIVEKERKKRGIFNIF